MKNPRDYHFSSLGSSDIAALTVTAFGADGLTAHILSFGSDGSYGAYIVDGDCKIPDHYKPVLTIAPHVTTYYDIDGTTSSGDPSGWIRISDDVHVTFTRSFTNGLTIYRAGDFGCIIQVC